MPHPLTSLVLRLIKLRLVQLSLWLTLLSAFPNGALRGDAIALSPDGVHWLPGSGGYGKGWGGVGEPLSVNAGATVYVRYYALRSNLALRFAVHGTDWEKWESMGPPISSGMGRDSAHPITLKLTNVGMGNCTVTWVDGPGTWTGPASPGAYDFALERDAVWNLPPLRIAAPPGSQPWLQDPPSGLKLPGGISVPDTGPTIALLSVAAGGAAIAWVLRRRRRLRTGTRQPDKGGDRDSGPGGA